MKNNRNKKKFISASLCVVFAALLILSGCGQKEARIDRETAMPGVTEPAIETTTQKETTTKETKQEEITTQTETATAQTEAETTTAATTTEQTTQEQPTTTIAAQQTQTQSQQTANTTAATTTTSANTQYSEPVTTYSNNEEQTAHTHNYVTRITKEATCANEGIITYTCEADGDTYTEYIPKTAHVLVPTIITEATCGTNGSVSYDCEVCGIHDHTDTIPATGNHNYVPVYKTESVTKYICDCGQSFDSRENWNKHSNASGEGHTHCATKQYSVNTSEIDHYECTICGQIK